MRQLKALEVKNWILYKRSPISSIIEILIPLLCIIFLVLARNLVDTEQDQERQFLGNQTFTYQLYGSPNIHNKLPPVLKNCTDQIVALTPKNDSMVISLKQILQKYGYTIKQYANDEQINEIVRSEEYGKQQQKKICFGVSFQNQNNNYNYSLRFTMNKYSNSEMPQTNGQLTLSHALDLQIYLSSFQSGAISITSIINNLILKKQIQSQKDSIVTKIAPIYQEKYVYDKIYFYLEAPIDFILLLPLIIVYAGQTSAMLFQKEKRIRESMLIMGMSLPIYYLTWFIRYFCVYLVIHIIGSGIIVSQFPNIPYYIPLIIFLLFDILLIIQSFFIQIFFKNSKLGVFFAILFFVSQFVISFIVSNNQNTTLEINTGVSVVAHVAFGLAFREMLYAEAVKIPLTFGHLLNSYKLTITVVSIILNIMFWGVLTWYLVQVFPNSWGVKHPCFCVKKKKSEIMSQNYQQEIRPSENEFDQNSNPNSVELGSARRIVSNNNSKTNDIEAQSVQVKYKQMESNNKALKIKNLYKKFDDFEAVSNLNMSLYSDQIFVLLGHNGAGKTTLLSMLTGILQPTSGLIQVCGQTKMSQIKKMIGICPQHDTLYDKLTVQEHIRLFGTLKGLKGEQLNRQIQSLIKDVGLEEKRSQYAKNLSGGQKRRLSVALAFSGGSKVIILDQPTSGMDTSARRYIWEMLKNYKNGRIILLTTHFMDEADYLGDRIAIMSHGKLIALGSNVYLKNKYGVGYNITFVKKQIKYPSYPIIQLVQKNIMNPTILSNVSSELSIQLPIQQTKKFPKLFEQISKKKEDLGIESYGISITTLEEVFLKIVQQQQIKNKALQDRQMEQIQTNQVDSEMQINQQDNEIENIENIEKQDGTFQRFFSHFKATLLKRFRVIKRDIKSLLFQLILPMLIIVIALQFMTINFLQDFPPQELSYRTYLDQTNPVLLPVAAKLQNSFILDSLASKISQVYAEQINVTKYYSDSDTQFDANELYAQKQQLPTLKGGIYFSGTTQDNNNNTFHQLTAIVNTKSPSSIFTVQTLAAEAYINSLANKNISITIINYPFPCTMQQLEINNSISGFLAALIFTIAIAFKFASTATFIVKERVDRAKHQQIISGMNIGSYWIGNYIYDYLLYVIVAVFAIIMCVALQIDAFYEGDSLKATAILFILFGLANIPFTYILSYLFISYGSAQGIVYFFNIITGGFLPIVVLLLKVINMYNSAVIGKGLAWALRFLPAFSFGQALINIGSLKTLNSRQIEDEDLTIFSMNIALGPIIFLIIFGILYSILVFVIEGLRNNQKFMRAMTLEEKMQNNNQAIDDDVLREQEKAIEADPSQYDILAKKLRKVFKIKKQKQKKVAVNDLSFGISKGQVFGLLGINGAGKTTTFKILAGQIVSTSGDSYFCGLKTSQNLSQIRKNLGYCPQFDVLIDSITAKQQMELYYDLKCLPSRFKERAIRKKITEMNLDQYENKISGTLSGGNKRKLSVAIAMIGNPNIVFLDEPSTGMDPKARRFMWKVISKISTQKKQSTVILTTHSMEEAEALATRLGIMVKGNFKCIGTPQHIKSKFGRGFELEIKINSIKGSEIQVIKNKIKAGKQAFIEKKQLENLLNKLGVSQNIKEQISQKGQASYIWQQLEIKNKVSINSVIQFCLVEDKIQKLHSQLSKFINNLEILQKFQTFIRFKTGSQITAGGLFQILEKSKQKNLILQYSIKQASVEQIFNKFAEDQGDPMEQSVFSAIL